MIDGETHDKKGVSTPFLLGEKYVRKWRFDFCEG